MTLRLPDVAAKVTFLTADGKTPIYVDYLKIIQRDTDRVLSIREENLSRPCPYCLSPVGELCRTKAGRGIRYAHKKRQMRYTSRIIKNIAFNASGGFV